MLTSGIQNKSGLIFAFILLIICNTVNAYDYTGGIYPSIVKRKDGIILKIKPLKKTDPRLIKIQVCTNKIIRVEASPADSFSTRPSLMVDVKKWKPVEWHLKKKGNYVYISTNKITVSVDTLTGRIKFYDSNGNLILKEIKGGGKIITPAEVMDHKTYHIQQIFYSPPDEAFYGLGQQQEGLFNYKGHDVELYQYNTKISIPFVISNLPDGKAGKNYGILWDNYSFSKFGDVHNYKQLSLFKLFNEDGNESGLTANYYNSENESDAAVTRDESQINYEFIPELKNLPKGFKINEGKVVWSGSFEPDSSGLYKFRLYAAGNCKLWINNRLIVSRWRQSWNAFVHLFDLRLEKGNRYPIRLEWTPGGGAAYISLKVKAPISPALQNDLSLYSEYAHQIDYYFIEGKNIDDVIGGYRQLTGKALIPPKWAFGFWQSRERYHTQKQLLGVAKKYRKLKIPFDNIVQDWFYWKEDQWGSQQFDTTRYPNPKAMIEELHNKLHEHFMISVWPKFYKGIKNYERMKDKGFLYMGNIKLGNKDWVGPGYLSTFYDAFNPGARKLFWKMIDQHLYPLGVDAWWLDASEPDINSNEPMKTRMYLMNPTALGPGAEYFNAYSLENSRAVYEGQMKADPNKRVFILTRSAFAGQQRYDAAVWSGDIASTWQDMAGQIPAGLNYCMSGLPYWTFDIGGFAVQNKFINAKGKALKEWRELLTRWYQFGAFCPIYRSHGEFPYREIFNVAPVGSPDYNAMVSVTKLRYRLMPYIYSLAGMVYFKNYTIMRALVMDFEHDKNVTNISNEYMFGPSLLVAPVTSYKEREKEVYLPNGYGWFNFYSGKYYSGGQKVTVNAPLNEIPLFIKEGSIIPIGPKIQYAEESRDKVLKLYVFTGKDASFTLYEDENNNNNYRHGKYSMIDFSYNEKDGKLTIGKRKGNFPGMLQTRTFEIVSIGKEKPAGLNLLAKPVKKVKYDGAEISIQLK